MTPETVPSTFNWQLIALTPALGDISFAIGFGKKEEFKEILAILRRQNPDRIRVL